MILKIIYGLIILGIIVFIHEMGHFLFAVLCGVKVEAFSIGMGPVVLHKKIKNVDWRLSLLPLGGYCSMKGEQDFAQSYENGDSKIYADSDSLYGVHPLKRALIAFAGPFFNLILTFVSFFIIALVGYSYWSASGKIQLANELYPEIQSAVAKSGLLSGDEIIQINNEKIEDFNSLFSFVSVHPDEDLRVKVLRNGSEFDFIVHSDLDKSTGAGKIGVASDPSTMQKREAKRYGFFGAIVEGAKQTKELFTSSIKGIQSLFKGVKITQAVSGPASITTMLGDTVERSFSADFRTGLSSILRFVAIISISLFIMNLLPIPVLDGGLILFSLIEAVFRIQIPPKIRYVVQYIGLMFIAFLFVIAVVGDFNYFLRLFNEK